MSPRDSYYYTDHQWAKVIAFAWQKDLYCSADARITLSNGILPFTDAETESSAQGRGESPAITSSPGLDGPLILVPKKQ